MTKILATGCLGFIGSHFVKYILKNTDWDIIGFNRDTDQRNKARLFDEVNIDSGRFGNSRFKLIIGDLANNDNVSGLAEEVDYIAHFGAKTFVDHSIRDIGPFISSNIVGTYNIMEEARRCFKSNGQLKRFIQVSTDEVYGSILNGAYKEDARLNPTNPYSATKAAGDMLALAYWNTYKLPVIITRTENNFGEFQHPQKVFPKFVKYALEGKKLPVYGDGKHIRQWIYVEDHCSAIYHLLISDLAKNGDIYHVAGNQELMNIELVKKILGVLGKEDKKYNDTYKWVEYIEDFNIRPGHDRRYALNSNKIQEIGWKPKYSLDEGIEKTVNWYKDNQWWLK